MESPLWIERDLSRSTGMCFLLVSEQGKDSFPRSARAPRPEEGLLCTMGMQKDAGNELPQFLSALSLHGGRAAAQSSCPTL